jgi:hypothetical protein
LEWIFLGFNGQCGGQGDRREGAAGATEVGMIGQKKLYLHPMRDLTEYKE